MFIDNPIFHAIVLIALTRLGIVTISGRSRNFSWRFGVDAVIADKSQHRLTSATPCLAN